MFEKMSFDGGYFYKLLQLDDTKGIFDWAEETAKAKVEHTMDSWQTRNSKFAKFVDIYYGDLAKNVVRKFIENNIEGIEIVEYDKIRNDDFKNHDLFDLKINNKKVEIKSSLEKKLSQPKDLFYSRRIIINLNNMHQTISDFVIQVFYVPDDINHYIEIEKMNNEANDQEFEKNCKNEVSYSMNKTSIYIAGWVDKKTQVDAINKSKNKSNNFAVSNYSTNARFREYANVMISDSMKLDELINILKAETGIK